MSCPASRVSLDSLAQTLAPYFPSVSHPALRSTLRHQLNSPYDKTPDGSNPYESVSRAEASWYVLEAQADLRQGGIQPERQTIMTVLQQMFFQGRADWSFPPDQTKYPTQISKCADGDTCTAVIQEDFQCPPLPEVLRFSAVDTPESFHTAKLNRVRDEVLQKLSLPPALAPLIQFRIQYAGKIASFIMKDFPVWLQSQGMHFAVGNSYVFTENKYQGLWQAYGTYLRRVVSLHAPPQAVARYFQERLPVLMATVGQAFYQEAVVEYTELFQKTATKLSFLAPQTLPNPATIYTPQVGIWLARGWQEEVMPTGYGDDWTAALIFMGVAYYYPKYKNQHGGTYSTIQSNSQARGIGLWQDLIFRVMDPQYSVPDSTPDPDV